MACRSVTVLGSSGSIGTQTVDLLAADSGAYQVKALVAGKRVDILAAQAKELKAEMAVIADAGLFEALKEALSGTNITPMAGREAVLEAASVPVDWTMAAITGIAGLAPTLAAAKNGKMIALANKEAIVSAGDLMCQAVDEAGAILLPVDSEHNAVFQSLADNSPDSVEKIILTASGGPFRRATREEMENATPETALRHPVWSMGAKISIDSATMMNKGLEIIEAARLFKLSEEKIEVVIHPQSVVHSMVSYKDGSVIAELGAPDMRIPIGHILAWPKRMKTHADRLDLTKIGKLEFEAPDEERFPALRLAREALRAGHGAPTIFNAANEIAVEAFLNKRLKFLQIAETVEAALSRFGAPHLASLDEVYVLDEQVGIFCREYCALLNR